MTHIEQIHPPQPVESPDDWVTQDLVPSRRGIDELNWIFSGERHGSWVPFRNGPPITHGVTDKCGDIGQVRCRRRDYPQKPVEVHTGGPYVARSEYERVCVERDEGWAQAARIRNEAAKLAAERDQLKADQEILLADLKNFEETTAALNNRVLGGNPNGWPLVPVDPACIPDGHRAVEVTKETKDKLVAVGDRAVQFPTNADHSNLVVEPIPTPAAPDTLPRPEFPAWIRAGWWVAMDSGGFWYMSEDEPIATEPVLGSTAGRGTWNPPNMDDIQLTHGVTASMKAVPCDRWRKAKWQIE